MDKLTEKQFCELYTSYNGEEINNIKQLISETFNGEELLEFINFCIKMKNEDNTKTKKN